MTEHSNYHDGKVKLLGPNKNNNNNNNNSFTCSVLLASLAHYAALIRSLAYLFLAHGEARFVYEMNASISYNFIPLCTAAIATEITAASPPPLHSG